MRLEFINEMSLLETKGLTKKFFGLKALDKVDTQVYRGEIVGLIGPNGSGKTTLFNCITGVMSPTSGKIIFKGEDITGLPPHKIALKGITRTFQIIRLFRRLTAIENLLIAVQMHQGESILGSIFRTPAVKIMESEAEEKAMEILELFDLEGLKNEYANNLSYGQQKLLEIGMTLMPNTDLVLLDEPTAAVNPTLINSIKDRIRQLNKKGQTFFIIEHNMDVVMDLCKRIIVLNHGEKIAEGSPEEIKNNEKVLEAYFGG
jgi:ABC-type branched-subunit amino acid transport system ATPase component